MKQTIINEIVKSLTESINEIILNEMAKKIDHRTIDRNVLLSVASACSRNRDTEAEFIKPMKKLTKLDLIDRYVYALIVMKKPCPKTEADIDKLKTFKLIGKRAIELGATIQEIQQNYNINMGITSAHVNAPVKHASTPVKSASVSAPIKKQRVPKPIIGKRYQNMLDNLIEGLPTSLYKEAIDSYSYGLSHNTAYNKYLKKNIEKFVKDIIKKSPTKEAFVTNLTDIFSNFAKVIPVEESNYKLDLLHFRVEMYESRSAFSSSTQYLCILIDKEGKASLKEETDPHSFSSKSRYYEVGDWFNSMLKVPYTQTFNRYLKITINLVDELSKHIMCDFIPKYLKALQTNMYAKNVGNSAAVLQKYKMNGVTDYFAWCQNYVPTIMLNNKAQTVNVNYGDWCGQVEDIVVYNNKVICNLYLQSDSSDTSSDDYFSNVFSNRKRYSHRIVRDMSDYKDPDDAIFRCTIDDMDELSEKVYNSIKSMIEKGMLV